MKHFFTWILLISALGVVEAQNINVSGKVVDSQGFPVSGVNISKQGELGGVLTDLDGKFSIVCHPEGTLIFSLIGFETREEYVGRRDFIHLVLENEWINLEELVVVGYGSTKRNDLTGSQSSVMGADLNRFMNASFEAGLNGLVPGLWGTVNSGQPGGASSLRIRGINTVGSSNEPLYVLDGLPLEGFSGGMNSPLSVLNPSDIETIEVLKDASAAAIYGSRAANGVVMITTKRGAQDQTYVNYNGYYGVQSLPKKLDLLDLQTYAQFVNERTELLGYGANFDDPETLGRGDDWQDALFEGGIIQNHNIQISHSGENSRSYFSVGYYDQEGLSVGSGFERFSARLNVDGSYGNHLTTGVSLSLSQSTFNNSINSSEYIHHTIGQFPDVKVKNDDGSWGGSFAEFNKSNPVAEASLIDNRDKSFFFSGNAFAELTLTSSLDFRTEWGLIRSFETNHFFRPTFVLGNRENTINESARYSNNLQYWLLKNYFTWSPNWDSSHKLNVLLGQEAQETILENISASRQFLVNNDLRQVGLGDASTARGNGGSSEASLSSYYSRINYNFDNRYFLTATYRADGSSKFAEGSRWGYFPSVSAAWKISEEEFFFRNVSGFENLKLRVGYGTVGNQNIANYAYGTPLNIMETQWGAGVITGRLANPDVKWETTKATNIGLDLNTYRNRIELVLDAYLKQTDDLLIQSPLPLYTGVGGGSNVGGVNAPWANIGGVENKGFEVSLRTRNILTEKFNWTTGIVFSMNRNKVTSLSSDAALIDGRIGDNLVTRTQVGDPVGAFYGYKQKGMFNQMSDFYYINEEGIQMETPRPVNTKIAEDDGVWVGDYIFEDVDGNGVIDINDRTLIGNPNPKFQFGFENQLQLGGFDLTFVLNGVYGNEVLNMARHEFESPVSNTSGGFSSIVDYARISEGEDAKVLNEGTMIPRISGSAVNNNYRLSDRVVEDGSYLRIQNLIFGYSLSDKALETIHLKGFRVFVNAQNLYTFSSYKGYDPEVGARNQNMLLSGIDFSTYPSPRIISFGANITF